MGFKPLWLRAPNSFPVEAQNPMQIVQMCWKESCFSQFSLEKHFQEDCRSADFLDHGLKTTGSSRDQNIFSHLLGFIACLQSISENEVQKKWWDFYEILESFLLGLMISIVVPLRNNVSVSLAFPDNCTVLRSSQNILNSKKALRKVRNATCIHEIVNMIKYFWHWFLEINLDACQSILETMYKPAVTVHWRTYHLRYNKKSLSSNLLLSFPKSYNLNSYTIFSAFRRKHRAAPENVLLLHSICPTWSRNKWSCRIH